MADYRTVKVSMWAQDEWFMDQDTEGKLLWMYLFTNSHTSVAGIYKLPMRTITFETGLDKQAVIRCLAQFAKDGKAYYEDSTIWVVKMRDHQATSSIKVTKRIEQDLDALPDTPLKKRYFDRYPIDTLSIPYQARNIWYPRLADETETETETETDPVRAAVAVWESLGLTVSGFMSQQIAESVREWSELGHPEYVAQAVEIAGKANKRSWAYVEGILKRCRADGTAPIYTNGKTEKVAPKPKAGTQFVRNPSPDGTEWIYYDTVTKQETRREPRGAEEIF